MELDKIIKDHKSPCSQCPYKLGIIRTPINPCPQCKANNYQMFTHLKNIQQN